MRAHLADLAMLGIVATIEKNEGMYGGKYREYSLKQELQVVLSALTDTIEYVGTPRASKHTTSRHSTRQSESRYLLPSHD